jgi:hypothetical protein
MLALIFIALCQRSVQNASSAWHHDAARNAGEVRRIIRTEVIRRSVPSGAAQRHVRRHSIDITAHQRNRPMLQLRPNCECCNRDLPPHSEEALICSFECTFCRACATSVLKGKCPNCGGELVPRPRRPAEKLAKFPASTERVLKPEGCANAA